MRHDHRKLYEWLIDSDWEDVSYVAPAMLPDEFYRVSNMGISYRCYDIDPRFKNNPDYKVCDVIFDPINLGNTVINFNAQKMYPIGRVHVGEFMIAGTSLAHNGDCNVISSCEQLIEQNNLHKIYKTAHIPSNGIDYFLVWGSNI